MDIGNVIDCRIHKYHLRRRRIRYFAILAVIIISLIGVYIFSGRQSTSLLIYNTPEGNQDCSKKTLNDFGKTTQMPFYSGSVIEAIGSNMIICTTDNSIEDVSDFFDKELRNKDFLILRKRILDLRGSIGEVSFEVMKNGNTYILTISRTMKPEKTTISMPLD